VSTFDKAVPVKILDNAIDRVAANVLSEEDQEERKARIQRLLHEEPATKKKKLSLRRMVTRQTASEVETVVISSDSDSESDESVLAIEEIEAVMRTMGQYGVEHSRSNRACCRVCSRPIGRSELRWFHSGLQGEGGYYDTIQYFHFVCFMPPHHVTYEQARMVDNTNRYGLFYLAYVVGDNEWLECS
jgi:hypothetical protein